MKYFIIGIICGCREIQGDINSTRELLSSQFRKITIQSEKIKFHDEHQMISWEL